MSVPVLAVEELRVTFPGPQGVVAVVDGIDFELRQGEVLGLVGESGSGKSMTLRALLQLKRRGMQISGRALWHGRDLLALPEHELISLRGKRDRNDFSGTDVGTQSGAEHWSADRRES